MTPELAVELGPGPRHPLGVPRPVPVGGAPARPARPARSARCARGDGEVGEPWGHQAQVEGARWRRCPRPGRPPRATGRTAGAVRPRPADRRWPTRGATPRGRPGCVGPAPRPGRWPEGTGPGWRSARCWWRPGPPPARWPAGPGRRCGWCRSGCRGPTARRRGARGRTGRPDGRATVAAAAGPPVVRAVASAPFRHPVRICQWPPWWSDQRVEGDDGLSLLPAGQVGLGDDPAEAGVPLGVAGQHHQVGAAGVGDTGAGVGRLSAPAEW